MKNDGIYVHPHRSVNDWYNLQKRIWNFEEINPDKEIIEKISDENWKVDLSLAHKNLKTKLAEYDNKNDPPDFFIMTDIEISKFPIETFFKIF